MKTNPKFYCKRCNGDGGWMDYDGRDDAEIYYECPDCSGTGMSKDKNQKYETNEKGSNRHGDRNLRSDVHGGG